MTTKRIVSISRESQWLNGAQGRVLQHILLKRCVDRCNHYAIGKVAACKSRTEKGYGLKGIETGTRYLLACLIFVALR